MVPRGRLGTRLVSGPPRVSCRAGIGCAADPVQGARAASASGRAGGPVRRVVHAVRSSGASGSPVGRRACVASPLVRPGIHVVGGSCCTVLRGLPGIRSARGGRRVGLRAAGRLGSRMGARRIAVWFAGGSASPGLVLCGAPRIRVVERRALCGLPVRREIRSGSPEGRLRRGSRCAVLRGVGGFRSKGSPVDPVCRRSVSRGPPARRGSGPPEGGRRVVFWFAGRFGSPMGACCIAVGFAGGPLRRGLVLRGPSGRWGSGRRGVCVVWPLGSLRV